MIQVQIIFFNQKAVMKISKIANSKKYDRSVNEFEFLKNRVRKWFRVLLVLSITNTAHGKHPFKYNSSAYEKCE